MASTVLREEGRGEKTEKGGGKGRNAPVHQTGQPAVVDSDPDDATHGSPRLSRRQRRSAFLPPTLSRSPHSVRRVERAEGQFPRL